MQTVKLNKKALVALGGVFLLFLCFISYLPSSSSGNKAAVRDVRIRKSLSHNLDSEPVLKVKDFEDLDLSDGKKPLIPQPNEKLKEPEVKENEKQVNVIPPPSASENDKRRDKVREMMVHAWTGYKNYSWGLNELKPISKQPNSQAIFGGREMPATIVDAADTLWIMDLKEQYTEARNYIRDHFDMSKATGTLSLFETTIRFLGGLLSLYALTKEEFYIDKARSVGDALLPAFNTPTGIPKSNLNMKTKTATNYNWANGGSSILAEYGSLHLEFVYLSEITKSPIFEKKVRKIRDVLEKAEKPNGLYPNFINQDTGKWSGFHHVSLGALGDSFYEYLIKSWLQSGKKDEQARSMYWDTSEAIKKNMVMKAKSSGLTYVAELRGGAAEHKMGHLACFCVGMFALEAVNEKDSEKRASTMNLAEELGRTCHESYIRSASHIGPEMFYFNAGDDATSRRSEYGYILRPEVIEGFFYLWRLTGKTMYRDWVWDAISSIDRYCRVDAGFAGLSNVYEPNRGHDDVQQSFFLAETLKYAYLTFTDNTVMNLDEWVFNTEAHPLPIKKQEL